MNRRMAGKVSDDLLHGGMKKPRMNRMRGESEGLAAHACAANQIIPPADRKLASKSCYCEPMI